MSLLKDTFGHLFNRKRPAAETPGVVLPNEPARGSSEVGYRTTPENEWKYHYRTMWVDPDLRQAILDIREMDRLDGRVKRIHAKIARDIVKGGLELQQATENKAIAKAWEEFGARLQLNRPEKLKSDAAGFVKEGNLPLQVVLDAEVNVTGAVRMPSETILPNVGPNGRFRDVRKAYIQFDIISGAERVAFPLWQLQLARLDPDNFDDLGALGRPYLDANRTLWRKMTMTEEDLVVRRRVRAPLRFSHVLEGASKEDLQAYRAEYEKDQGLIHTDFYQNKKGGVNAVQGDANLDQIKDIALIHDAFFSGSGVPKGLLGYTDTLARDILEDLKRDFYEEVDGMQGTLAFHYEQLFKLHLLLRGINPAAEDFTVAFRERSTETRNQRADYGLKMAALGYPFGMIWEQMGHDPAYVRERIEWERKNFDPYPDGTGGDTPKGRARVSVTPGNRPKGESATSIKNR